MKKFISAAVAALFLAAQNPALALAAGNATVEAVRVSSGSVYIETDRPVEYRSFMQRNPPKLIVELVNSRLRTLEDIPAGGDPILKVRTGQFKTSPVSVSRVVMDLARQAPYTITRNGGELAVVFGGSSSAPEIKDAPSPVPAGVKVIAPGPDQPQSPADPVRTYAAPAARRASVVSERRAPRYSSTRDILDNLPRDPISFDYNDADVREVFDMLAAKANINIIYDPDVSGTVTISLTKVPFNEAFKTLLNIKGLAAEQVGDNILRIATPGTFLAEQKKAMPETRVFFLNYARASDVMNQISAVATAENRNSAKCTVDAQNNALIVTDTPLGLDATARLIHSLDRVPKQVMIEVKLVEVDLSHSLDMGVNWSFSNNSGGISGGSYFPGPVPGGAVYGGSFTFGKMLGNTRLDAVIAAAVHDGKAKVLSDPKVATLNNKEANINITDQTPYDQQTVTVVNGVSQTAHAYSNVTTGITLKVTPTINSDGRITMHLVPSVIQLTGTPNGVAPPPTATRDADTNVIVRDGETIVIGGLIQDIQTEDVYKVPLLGDIPVLGALFRKKSTSRKRVELLIFVTPRTVEA